MRFNVQIATGRASCKKCQQVIPKGKPCLELVYSGGTHKNRDKVCLPCLEVLTADVIYLGIGKQGEGQQTTEPISLNSQGIGDYITESFEQHIKGITLTDQEIEQFIQYLEADISDWISENWRSFMSNRGD